MRKTWKKLNKIERLLKIFDYAIMGILVVVGILIESVHLIFLGVGCWFMIMLYFGRN